MSCRRHLGALFIFIGSFIIFSGCVQQQGILDAGNQVQLRSMQTRVFDTDNKKFIIRGVIATLQDLNFILDRVDADLGTVSATKLHDEGSRVRATQFGQSVPGKNDMDYKEVRVTVTVRPKSKVQMRVRANFQYNLKPVMKPKSYQQFFVALGKSLFLSAQLDDADKE